MSHIRGINRWRIGDTGAFGAGLTEDEDGNKIYDLLESVDTYDRGQYGRVVIQSTDEETFGDLTLNQDVDGNPDYINNYETSALFTMNSFIANEVVHVVKRDTDKSPTSFNTKMFPIIKDYENQSCYVVNADGQADFNKKVTLTFTDWTASKDRLGSLATKVVNIQITDAAGAPVELSMGQKILFSYTIYVHTDTLRDLDSGSFWSTTDDDTDTNIIFDLNPFGANSTVIYNNIELVFRDLPYAVGPFEYILQGASVQANTRQRYRFISNGYISAKSEGESFVIKFDEVDYRYLKLILIGTPNEEYNVVSCEIRNSVAEAKSSSTSAGNVSLIANRSGNLQLDYNPAYDMDLGDYSLTDLSDVDYLDGMGLMNQIYHKEYLNDNYPLVDFGIKSGDFTPLTGSLDFSFAGVYNILTSGNSAGIDYGALTSGNHIVLRDKYIYNSGSIFEDSSFKFYYSDDNSTYVEQSGFSLDVYNNGLGTDLVFSNLDFYGRYAKISFVSSFSGNAPILGFANDSELLVSPTVNYLRIAKQDPSYTDMFNVNSQIDGSGSYIQFTEVDYDFAPSLFNRSIATSGYSAYETSGENYYAEDIYTLDASGNLSQEDFYLMNAIPYYADTVTVNSTISKGKQIEPAEFNDDNIAKMYIPHNDNSGYEERSDYKLIYYNLRYGTQLAYQGIPAKSDVDLTQLKGCSVRNLSEKVNTVDSVENLISLDMDMDVPQITAVGNSETLTLKFKGIVDYKVYAVSVTDKTSMTLLTDISDYTLNPNSKKLITSASFVNTYDNHYIAVEYEYPIFKNDLHKSRPLKHFNFVSSEYEKDKIQLSGIKIYPTQYFKDYLTNNESNGDIYVFEVNPEAASIDFIQNAAIVKLLDGQSRRDTFSAKSKQTLKVDFPKVTEEMKNKLLQWYESGDIVGLANDLHDYIEGFLLPNSFSFTRRKTTAVEYANNASSYSCSFTFQER